MVLLQGRSRVERAQAAQRAGRRVPAGDGRRSARRPGRRTRLRRPRAHEAAGLRRQDAGPRPLRGRRQPQRHTTAPASASSWCRRPRWSTSARRTPAIPARSAAATLSGERVIEVGNIFQLGTKYSRADGGDVPRRAGRRARHRHGQLRYRPRAHRRRGGRAAPRRPRHLLAGRHCARSRCIWSSCGPPTSFRPLSPTHSTPRSQTRARRPLRRSRACRRASSSKTLTFWAAPSRWWSVGGPARAWSSSSCAPRASGAMWRPATCPRPCSLALAEPVDLRSTPKRRLQPRPAPRPHDSMPSSAHYARAAVAASAKRCLTGLQKACGTLKLGEPLGDNL